MKKALYFIYLVIAYNFIFSLSFAAAAPLEELHQRILHERGIAFKGTHIVITPTYPEDADKIWGLYDSIDEDQTFVSPFKLKSDPGYAFWKDKYLFNKELYARLPLDARRQLPFVDYSIFIIDPQTQQPLIVGHYNIQTGNNIPDTSQDYCGWGYFTSFLSPLSRGQGIGTEAKRLLVDSVFRPLIGQRIFLSRYSGNMYSKFREHVDGEVTHKNFFKYYKRSDDVKLELTTTLHAFQGLKAMVNARNKASIRVNEKCGWKEVKSEVSGYRTYVIDKK